MELNSKDVQTVTTLAVAGSLGATLLREVMGNDLATTLEGDNVTNDQLQLLLQQRILKAKGVQNA